MAYSFRHTSPELVGVLIKERVRCGKQNCHCVQRKHLHGPYYYCYWRDYQNGGILRKRYIPHVEVTELRKNITTLKKKDKEEKMNFQLYLKLCKELL